MGDLGENTSVKRSIASAEHEELLNVIDKIRSHGISRYIDLPQIVVCGDQSSGKSSCLEGLCGLRFPVGDGLCTRFATEYILRRSSEVVVKISIVPDVEHSDEKKAELSSFIPSTSDLDKFDVIVKEASSAMGIGITTTFAHDTLRIEICGPSQPHLTLVDLPGLFHSHNKDQSLEDKEAVFSLVRSYIEKSRSIILAVATAKNDLQNQTVLDFVREHDPKGTRTLGIITKPDTLPKDSPSELSFFTLAENKDIKFTLGWHVLRNRSYEERDVDSDTRDRNESKFFSEGIWQSLEAKSKGVTNLRLRLSKILQNHILRELPHLLKEVDAEITTSQDKLKTLGSSRGTAEQQRLYLLEASQRFTLLISSAVYGRYEDVFFGSSSTDSGYQRRLRACCKAILMSFAEKMRTKGHAVELVHTVPKNYTHRAGTPLKMTRDDFYHKVEIQMVRNAGTELPGFWNPSIIGDLFFDQASPWQTIVASMKDDLLRAVHTTIRHVLDASADDNTIRGILREIIQPHLAPLERGLTGKVFELLEPHIRGHPITLNHYLIANLQEKRQDEARKDMSRRVHQYLDQHNTRGSPNKGEDAFFSGTFNLDGLINCLVTEKTEVDMNRFAAIEASNAADAYYQVALKNVLDAVTMYAIERCLLTKLPAIFTPQHVLGLDIRAVTRIAGESEESMVEREALQKKLIVLEETQGILYRLDQHKPDGIWPLDGRSQSLTAVEDRRNENNGREEHPPTEPDDDFLSSSSASFPSIDESVSSESDELDDIVWGSAPWVKAANTGVRFNRWGRIWGTGRRGPRA